MSCVNCSSNNGNVELIILWQAGSEEFEVHNIHKLNKFNYFCTENENTHLLKTRPGVPIIKNFNRQRYKKQALRGLVCLK